MNTQIKKRWTPILESLGVTAEHPRFQQLCEYAEIQKNLYRSNAAMNENVNWSTISNSQGFGDVVMPGLSHTPGVPGSKGSGDIAQTMLPASVKLAAHTPGLNLLPTINVDSNRVDKLYYDWKYDDYHSFDKNVQHERGTTFKLDMDDTDVAAIKAWLAANGIGIRRGYLDKEVFLNLDGTDIAGAGGFNPVLNIEKAPAGTKFGVIQFKGFSYHDGMPIFRIFSQTNTIGAFKQYHNTLPEAESISYYFDGTALPGQAAVLQFIGSGTTSIPITGKPAIYEVSLDEDFVDDFTANRSQKPMTRGQWDVSTAGKIGVESFIKTIEIGVRHISAVLRLSELNDFRRMHGVDIVAKTREKMLEQMQQAISVEIVEAIKAQGEKNRSQVAAASVSNVSPYDLDVQDFTTGSGLYESSFSLARKVWQRVKSGAFFIKSDGRWGMADYVITSGDMAAMLSEMKGFQALPFQNHQLSINNSIEALGSIDGLTIYVDPGMLPGETNLYLGRVGGTEDPGLKFFAYMLAEQVEIVPEATLGSLMYLYSRYAIDEYGFFPEKQYLAIHVHDNNKPADLLI